MTNAVAWLNDLMQWLGRWVPRLVMVEPTHRGVLFGPRGSARQVGPGVVVYWPISHALVQVPVTTQSIQLSAQVMPFEGDTGMLPRVHLRAAAVQVRVHDAVKAATRALHIFALVDNRAQAAIARFFELRDDPSDWARAAAQDLNGELEQYGVTVERLDFTQHGVGVALKNIADWNYSDHAAGTRPA
jgi:hypothetical protein